MQLAELEFQPQSPLTLPKDQESSRTMLFTPTDVVLVTVLSWMTKSSLSASTVDMNDTTTTVRRTIYHVCEDLKMFKPILDSLAIVKYVKSTVQEDGDNVHVATGGQELDAGLNNVGL